MSILDETYIAIYILATNCKSYRNEKSYLLQNIFIVYDFNMKCTYGLKGLKELAYDKQVLNNAIETKKF